MEDLLQMARATAEHKLDWIIERYGDANGERRKPYYMDQLIREAAAAIGWKEFCMTLMDSDKLKAPVTPTKVSGA